MPVLEQSLLGHNDALDFNRGFLKGVAGGSGLFLLGDELSLVERLLLVESLDFLVHVVDEQILLLFGVLEVAHVLLRAVGCAAGQRNFALHDFVVLLDLLESTVELVQFLLGFQYALELLISFLFLALVLALQDLVLTLSFDTVALHDVVVVVGTLESRLHLGQLVLNSVELHTSFLAALANLADFLFLFAEGQIDTLVLIRQLLSKSVLQTGHEGLKDRIR